MQAHIFLLANKAKKDHFDLVKKPMCQIMPPIEKDSLKKLTN